MGKMLKRVIEEICRRVEKTFLDGLEEFRRNSSASQHVPVNQSLQLEFLPLAQTEVTSHP